MKVSAIVLTYNRAHFVTEAIGSILDQTFKDFELIVVDNCSSDNTESVVKSSSDKRIRYFKNQNNGFMGVNRNYGIEKSSGEYIAFLDDDDLWLPEKLEKQIELLDSNKGLGLVYSDSYIMDSNGKLEENTYFYGRRPVRGNTFDKLLENNLIPMLTVMIRKEVLNRVGVFNPRYKIALDYDLWLRIAAHYPIDFIEQPLAKYRVYTESGSQKNVARLYREIIQILNWWLDKGTIDDKATGEIKRREAWLHLSLMKQYFRENRHGKIFGELVKLLRLFPHNLEIVPSVISRLSSYRNRK